MEQYGVRAAGWSARAASLAEPGFEQRLRQTAIRFDTTNPRTPCIEFLRAQLEDAGCETQLYEKEPGRPNLVSRIAGGDAPPLLLQGHVDVVTTAGQNWTHPPFEARLEDGYVWGRGALDMKAGVAMLVNAFVRAKREGVQLPGDLVLVVLCDEENGGNLGARYLVEEHPELFEGMRYAPRRVRRLHAALGREAVLSDPGGREADLLAEGDDSRARRPRRDDQPRRHRRPARPLPHRPRPQAAAGARHARRARDGREDRRRVAAAPGRDHALAAEATPDRRRLRLLGAKAAQFEPMLRNTVNATIVRGGAKINVVPSEIELELDGRALPGFTPEQVIAELHDLAGDDIEVELVRHDPGAAAPDLGLFETLAEVIRELDPEGIPVPLLQIGVTDGRFFSQAGVQTYGFLPMRLPEDFDFTKLIHAADERIPVDAVEFGAEAVWRAVQRFH